MDIQFTDSHAHLSSKELYGQIETILSRAVEANVRTIINICTDQETLERGLDIHQKHPYVHVAGATTPHDVESEGELYFPLFSNAARAGKLIAVGETGLDYHYHHSPADTQQHFLRRYLHLALECKLPIIIHCRDAFADLFTILDSEYVTNGKHAPGVLHCFTGTEAEAEQVIKRGWYLSLSGIATFKKSDKLREVARMVPLNNLLIETDAPYLAPQSKRGQLNEPAYLPEIAQVIATVKNISVEEVASVTTANARKLFSIKGE